MSLPPPESAPPPPPPPSAAGFTAAPPPGYQAYVPQPYLGPVAGFGTRLGGWLLDYLLYGLLSLVFVIPGIVLIVRAFDDCVTIAGRTSCESVSGGSIVAGIVLILGGLVVVFLIYARQLGRTGQTWGRRIVGIRVVSLRTGEPLGFGKAVGRTLFEYFISGQILYLGYLWMLWDDNRQTWHDKVVGSQVVRV